MLTALARVSVCQEGSSYVTGTYLCVCVCVCLSGCQELRHRELISRRERVDQNTSFNTVKQQNKLKRQLSLIDDIQSVMTQRGPYSVLMCLCVSA